MIAPRALAVALAVVALAAGCEGPPAGRDAAARDAGVDASCPRGFAPGTAGFADVDECAAADAPCGPGACTNLAGGYLCACPTGFTVVVRDEGPACADEDECAARPSVCVAAGAVCENRPDGAGYACACPAGYAATPGPFPRCVDVDECGEGNGGCAQTCRNVGGSFECACGPGFRLGADARACDDVDECAEGLGGCSPDATCENVIGGARCTCRPGFEGDGVVCTDVDECLVGHGGCDARARCENTPGGRACACPEGTCGDGLVCLDAALCAAPTGLEATPGDARVALAWDDPGTSATWVVRRALDVAGPFVELGTTTSRAFVDATAVNETTYAYTIAVRSALGEGPAAPPVTATPVAPPSPPTGLAAEPSDATIMLRWSVGARAARTRLRRTTLPGGPTRDLGVSASDSYVDTGLENGVRYAYAASSENAAGTSAWTPDVEATPIAVPTGLVAVPGDRQIALFWGRVVGAVAYELERAPDPAGPFAVVATTTSTGLVDAPLTNGVSRAYRVVAVSALGRGAPSRVVVATPAADASPAPPAEDPTRNGVGLNVWFNADWDGAGAFVDAMEASRPWQDGVDWHLPVAGTDALGWPTADASTVVYSGPPDQFNGTYRLVFEGQATVSVMWCPGAVTGQTYDAATNTTRADVTFRMTSTGSVGLVFRNTRRTPTSPLGSGFANARLYRPGYPEDGSVVFTAPFLAALSHARVVRLMEWAGGGSNVVARWADRVTPAHATDGGLPAPPYTAPDGTVFTSTLGVSLEHQIALCNALMVDCWLTVPAVADDEYVRQMALALRFGTDGRDPYTAPVARPVHAPLHPSLRAYIEYGNENWNSGSGFLSFHMIHAIAAHLPPTHPAMIPAPDSIWTVVWRYPAWRTAVISEIFRAVFGDAAMMTRIRPVLMTQVGNAQDTLGAALRWLEPYAASMPTPRRVADLVYAAGGSGYYGVNSSVSAIPDVFFADGNYPDVGSVRAFGLDSLWAANVGVRHIAYEGGPGLSFGGGDNRTLNADSRMQTMVEATHDAWTGAGGDLLVYYNVRGPSEWEFTPDIRDASTPKLRALDAIQARPRAPVTLGGALPGALVARSLSTTIRSGFGYDYTVDGLPCAAGFATTNFVALPGHAAAAYDGTLVVRGYASTATRLGVVVNGVRQGEVTLPGRSGTAHLDDSTPLPVRVPAGLVAVRLEVLSGALTLYSVTL